ncbi:MAG: UMP kinase [Clostridiales bacterium]|jgi:uridylate kinase|nr:UMP kinase [Clostridiales bacterium]
MIKRAVVKLSGEALAGSSSGLYDDSVVEGIAEQIGMLKEIGKGGFQVAIIVGGGNIWRGRSDKSKISRSSSDQIGMLGTVMNGIYVAESFSALGIPARLMTPFAVGPFADVFSRKSALAALEAGETLVFAGGLGHPYFSTDTITALRAAELDADCVFYAKSVDGIYDSDPKINLGARKFKAISYQGVLERGLKAVDISAMSLSSESGMDSFIFGLDEPSSIVRAVLSASGEASGDDALGTRVSLRCKEEYYV